MADESGMRDYFPLSLRSIRNVNSLVTRGVLDINVNVCRSIICNELQITKDFLVQNREKLLVKNVVHDRRRVALLHLYPVVKQAENLVRHCCKSNDLTWLERALSMFAIKEDALDLTWPERALSVFAIKEDALDILLHLRWWTSVLDIVIDAAVSEQPNLPSMQHMEFKRLERANEEFEDMLNVMALFDLMDDSSSNKTQRKGSLIGMDDTLRKIVEQHGTSYTGELGTKEHIEFILSWNYHESDSMGPAHGIMFQRSEHGRFKDILMKCIELQNAAVEDRQHLVNKALEVMKSYTGDQSGSRERRSYLLANQVHFLLTGVEIDGIPELNDYESKRIIRKGDSAVVHQATWCGFDCVLKQIIIDPNDQEDINEAKCLKRLSHPHIVKFYHHFKVASPDKTGPYCPQSHIVMERMTKDLEQYMSHSMRSRRSSSSRGVPFSEQVTVDIMLQLAKAMWHMHSKHVIHRGLNPVNVLVRQVSQEEVPELFDQGYVQVKLGGFGLAREQMLSSHSQLPMSCKGVSTSYRAPELSSRNFTFQKLKFGQTNMVETKYPHKLDVWSFGIMSSQILSGERPYGGRLALWSTLLADIQKGVRPCIPDDCPDYLKFIIESCWKYEPLERPRFSDIWRMLRIAKLRSLGLINHNHEWFGFKERNDNPEPVSSRPAQISLEKASTRLARSSKTDPAQGAFPFRMPNFLIFKMLRRLKWIPDQGIDFASPHKQQFGFLTNMVWPRERPSDWKLDVIFFEGNVGGRKHLSCRDTWLQRNQPEVFWPQDWLPQDVGKDIRVLVLEYCISEAEIGLEDLVSDINEFLISSELWNQNRTWQRPIVLVGHSLGCTVIEALVLYLDRNARRLHEDTTSDYDRTKAETSRAFLSSLKGCFFYAHPGNGLVRNPPLLREVFGGLTYSEELFPSEFCEGSERLQKRSSDFLKLTQTRNPHISLMSLMEGRPTRGGFLVNRPKNVFRFEHTLVLEDSNHIETCKPVDTKHASYQELVKFLEKIYGDCDYGKMNDISMLGLMHEEIMAIENIFEASLKDLDGEETIVLCNYNTKDDLFEFYFKYCEDMASVVGVGLEYAKVILIKGWEVKVEETLEEDWVQAWKKVESSSTTMSKLLRVESNVLSQGEKEVFMEENFLKPLLWDLAKYFTLKKSMDLLAKCATNNSGSSSNSQGSSNNDNKESIFQEGFPKWFFENRMKKGRLGKDNNDDEGNDKGKAAGDHGPSDAIDMDVSTKVMVELLPGGEIFEMPGGAFDENNHGSATKQKLKTLDRSIFSSLEFTFVNRDGVKKIEVIVGNISFNLGFNADHGSSEQVKWTHTDIKVSFGLLGDDIQKFGEVERDSFKQLDVKIGTQNSTASRTIEEKKGKEFGGRLGLYGTPNGVGLRAHVEGKTTSGVSDIQQLQTSFERSFDVSEGGLIIERQMDPDESQVVCDCNFTQSNTYDLSKSPMSFNQVVRFQATWIPLDVGGHGVSLDLVPYTLKVSRSLEENVSIPNAKAIQAANVKTRKTWFGRGETAQHEPHVTCKQRFCKTLHINHAMTHLDGKFHRLRERERLHDKSRYFSREGSRSPYKWKNGALVKLQEEVSSTQCASSVATTSSSGWSFLGVQY